MDGHDWVSVLLLPGNRVRPRGPHESLRIDLERMDEPYPSGTEWRDIRMTVVVSSVHPDVVDEVRVGDSVGSISKGGIYGPTAVPDAEGGTHDIRIPGDQP